MSLKPDFTKSEDGLVPAIIQDRYSQNVLMLGYMNEEAWEKTQRTGQVTFFSRSKQRLWTKGETSGNFLQFVSAELDCDKDTLLIQANPQGPACHLNNDTCFNESPNQLQSLRFLDEIVKDRKQNPKEGSYTNLLLNNLNKSAQKVGEEAVELVIEAKDNNKDLFLNEAADLLYHFTVLLHTKGEELHDVLEVLRQRER